MITEIISKFKNCLFNKCYYDNEINKIVVAVSGGADSVCLLLLLNELFGHKNIYCAHFNHKIRNGDAEKDAEFTRKIAQSCGIEFIYAEKNVKEYARINKMGLEEAARKCRYDFLKEIASKLGDNTLIAIAHNLNDRVETIIHNISRGTSIDGLKGIEYKRDNIIRPLLDISRKEIEEVCHYYNVTPAIDITNFDNKYKRNLIRNDIIPYLSSKFGNDFARHIINLSESAIVDSNYLQLNTIKAYQACCNETFKPFNKIYIDINLFNEIDVAIQNRLIRYILSKCKKLDGNYVFPEYTGIYSDMILRVKSFLKNAENGKYIEVGSGIYCVKSYGKYYFSHKSVMQPPSIITSQISINEESVEKITNLKEQDVLAEKFDADVLENLYGKDFLSRIKIEKYNNANMDFVPFGMSGHKQLRKFLIDCKIGHFERKFIEYISIDNDILWIPNLRRSNIAPIDKNTTRVIIIKYASD